MLPFHCINICIISHSKYREIHDNALTGIVNYISFKIDHIVSMTLIYVTLISFSKQNQT